MFDASAASFETGPSTECVAAVVSFSGCAVLTLVAKTSVTSVVGLLLLLPSVRNCPRAFPLRSDRQFGCWLHDPVSQTLEFLTPLLPPPPAPPPGTAQLLTRLAVSYVLTIYLPGPASLRTLDAALWRDNMFALLQSRGRALILLDLLASNHAWLAFHFPSTYPQAVALSQLLSDAAGFVPELALEAIAVLKRLGVNFLAGVLPLVLHEPSSTPPEQEQDKQQKQDLQRALLARHSQPSCSPHGALASARDTLVLLGQGLYHLVSHQLHRSDLISAFHLPPLHHHARVVAALMRLDPLVAALVMPFEQCDALCSLVSRVLNCLGRNYHVLVPLRSLLVMMRPVFELSYQTRACCGISDPKKRPDPVFPPLPVPLSRDQATLLSYAGLLVDQVMAPDLLTWNNFAVLRACVAEAANLLDEDICALTPLAMWASPDATLVFFNTLVAAIEAAPDEASSEACVGAVLRTLHAQQDTYAGVRGTLLIFGTPMAKDRHTRPLVELVGAARMGSAWRKVLITGVIAGICLESPKAAQKLAEWKAVHRATARDVVTWADACVKDHNLGPSTRAILDSVVRVFAREEHAAASR